MTMVLLGYASANSTYNFNLDNALGALHSLEPNRYSVLRTMMMMLGG